MTSVKRAKSAKPDAMLQGALFELPAKPKRNPLDDIVPLYAPGEPRPWDVIDAADQELGWEHRYVDHRRATQIRLELRGTT